MSVVITGIGELSTHDDEEPVDGPFAVVLDGDRVAWTGRARDAPSGDTAVDVGGRAVLPGWVDSHTHLVFAGDRGEEFARRVAGEPYTASGIQVTVDATRAASDADLAERLRRHVAEAARQGTTCLETKTGYGLTVADEARAARIAAEVVDEVTFLGAHLTPTGTTTGAYLDLVCGPMLDAVAAHVRWIDVFCEDGAFDGDAAARVLAAGAARGLGGRVHGNQLGPGPGVAVAVAAGAASVDHATHLTDEDVDALAGSGTVATLLPACDLATGQPPAPARRLVDAGATVALASNANPGSCYTTSMALCVALAVLQGGLSVPEAVRAATLGGARALRRDDVGHLRVGARADLHVLDAPTAVHLAQRPGVPLTAAVWRAGRRVPTSAPLLEEVRP
ncbi:imidazolonepropionase [Actinomycetospora straminea]|uniref:Imidazolonepropionase n=1 Tax=Actinomycetospora straminea TaxID=663607 RepID=A0ABP9EEC1_9PSEU|nr:imidazolonepropionase [Actinomycetospora straminea]MDD7935637.1 imidazolonepropionase [Actinomycetospora straminea]